KSRNYLPSQPHTSMPRSAHEGEDKMLSDGTTHHFPLTPALGPRYGGPPILGGEYARIAQAGGIGGPARGSDSASSAAVGAFCARPGDGAKVSAHGDHVPYGQVQLPVCLLPSAADEPR